MHLISRIIGICFLLSSISAGEITLYVSPAGSDSESGTESSPLKTINAAIGKIPINNVESSTIILRAGTYNPGNGIVIDSVKNLTIKTASGENVSISGGTELDLNRAEKITNQDIAIGIPEKNSSYIKKLSLQSFGIRVDQIWSEDLLSKTIFPELYYGSTKLDLSRWPEENYALVDKITPVADSSSVELSINNSPFNNKNVNNGLAFLGYWYWDWYANYLMPDSYNQNRNVFIIGKKKSPYGFRAGQRFYAVNFMSGLTKQGTWAIDRSQQTIYFWLPSGNDSKLTITTCDKPLLLIKNSANVNVQGIRFTISKSDAISIDAGKNIIIRNCEVKNVSANGIAMSNCSNCIVEQNIISNIGINAITCSGGSENNLVKADNYIVGNTIINWGVVKRVYSAAVEVGGAGSYVLYNSMRTAPHYAVLVNGNSHFVAYNDISDVCRDAQDMGIIYTGRDWTARNTINQNYLHASGTGDVNAIYLDDMVSGDIIENNLIENVPTALKLGGGRDIKYSGNIAVNCTYWIKADNRAMIYDIFRKHIIPGGTCYERLVAKSYKAAPWTSTFPSLQFILDDDPAIPKGNSICNNISVGNLESTIVKEIFQYGIVDSNQTVPNMSDAETIIKGRKSGFVGKDNVGAKAYKTGMYKNFKLDSRQQLLPILQEKIISSDRITFIFAQTSYLNKMNVTLQKISTGSNLQKIYRSPTSDTVIFNFAPGGLIMRARYTGIEGVLNTDLIEEHINDTSQSTKVYLRSMSDSTVHYSSKLAFSTRSMITAKNGMMKIGFTVPCNWTPEGSISNEAVRVKIELFDIVGRKIITNVDGFEKPGIHSTCWDGKQQNGLRITAGKYLLLLTSG